MTFEIDAAETLKSLRDGRPSSECFSIWSVFGGANPLAVSSRDFRNLLKSSPRLSQGVFTPWANSAMVGLPTNFDSSNSSSLIKFQFERDLHGNCEIVWPNSFIWSDILWGILGFRCHMVLVDLCSFLCLELQVKCWIFHNEMSS